MSTNLVDEYKRGTGRHRGRAGVGEEENLKYLNWKKGIIHNRKSLRFTDE